MSNKQKSIAQNIAQNFNYRFSKRVTSIQVSAIKRMPLIASSIPETVSLGQGIPSLQTPRFIREAVIKALEQDKSIGKYSLQPGLPALKSAVAKRIAMTTNREVNADTEVFICAGAMEGLLTTLTSIIEEGDEVIVFDPSYASHIEQVLFCGGRPVFVELERENNWRLNSAALKAAITSKTKAIIVCNPGNPTGKVFAQEELDVIAQVALESNLLVVADETYDFLVFEGEFKSLTEYPEISDRVIACYSFSKKFAMTGWRVGYVYAPAPVIEQALKVHDAAVICAPTISQYAALSALTEEAPSGEEDIKEVLRRRRDLTCDRLDKLCDLFDYIRPNGAYYILARYLKSDLNSEEFALKLLHEARVITIPGRAFGPSGESHIRLSFGSTEAEINEAFDRIELWNRTYSK